MQAQTSPLELCLVFFDYVSFVSLPSLSFFLPGPRTDLPQPVVVVPTRLLVTRFEWQYRHCGTDPPPQQVADASPGGLDTNAPCYPRAKSKCQRPPMHGPRDHTPDSRHYILSNANPRMRTARCIFSNFLCERVVSGGHSGSGNAVAQLPLFELPRRSSASGPDSM